MSSRLVPKNYKIIQIKNIIGTPSKIEVEVNRMLDNGYVIGSELIPWNEPNTKIPLFVQQMFKCRRK